MRTKKPRRGGLHRDLQNEREPLACRRALPKMADSQSAAGCQPAVLSADWEGRVELCGRVVLGRRPAQTVNALFLQVPLQSAHLAMVQAGGFLHKMAKPDR